MVTASGWKKFGIVALFLAPSFVALLMFSIGPMVGTSWVSLHEWNLIKPATFIGLDNYRELWGDEKFRRALRNTLYYLVGYLPLVTVGGLALALMLNRKVRGVAFFRALYFLPVVTSWVVVSLLWKWLLNPKDGLINVMLGWVGIDGPGWWTSPTWAMPSVILASAWKDLGFVMVILLAGLQAIPETLYEAARIDGAGMLKTYRSIILPLSMPAFVVTLIWQFTSAWNDFLFALFLTTRQNGPVTYALNELAGGQNPDYPSIMAGVLLASLPTLLVYILLGRYFIGGLMSGSVK